MRSSNRCSADARCRLKRGWLDATPQLWRGLDGAFFGGVQWGQASAARAVGTVLGLCRHSPQLIKLLFARRKDEAVAARSAAQVLVGQFTYGHGLVDPSKGIGRPISTFWAVTSL